MVDRLGRVAATYGDVVRSRAYFPLWLANLLSAFGDTLHYIALVVLVYQITGEGVAVAALVVAEMVPVLALGPVAGVIIDRFDRKAVLIGADLFRAALVLSLLWPQGVWHAYAVAAGLAAGTTFFNPAVQATIPALTTEDQRLAANSVAWSTGRLVQIVASAVAGGLVGYVGTGPAFALNAASFLVSAVYIARLPALPRPERVDGPRTSLWAGYLRDAREGLSYAFRDRFVSRIVVVQALASLATGATGALLVVLAEQHYHLPPSGFAWLIAAIGAGALLGPLIPNALARDYRDARWLLVPYILRGLGDILLAVTGSVQAALVMPPCSMSPGTLCACCRSPSGAFWWTSSESGRCSGLAAHY